MRCTARMRRPTWTVRFEASRLPVWVTTPTVRAAKRVLVLAPGAGSAAQHPWLDTQAKQLARDQNVTLRSLAEEGLRKVIEERTARRPRRISPVTFRGQGLSPEFQGATWQRIRDAAFEGHGS